MHAEHPFSARPRSTAIACMQGIHTTPSIPVQHPWEKKLDVRPAPSHQSAAVLFQPWDADVAVQHTPRHVLLELRPFRRASTEEALQHQTTLVLKGSLDLMGTNGIVEIPAAHVAPPLSRLATDTVDEAYPVICAPRHPRSLTRNGGNWSNPKQATQMDVRDVVGQENPQLVPTTQHLFWFVGGHCVPGGRGRHTCPAHCADGRTQEPAPRIKRDRPSAGAFVPSFRPSFGNLPGPALQPWHRVACQGCCQRIIRRKRLAVLIDQSSVAAASQPPYLSCPSPPPSVQSTESLWVMPLGIFVVCDWDNLAAFRCLEDMATEHINLAAELVCDLRTPLLGGIQGTDLGCCHAQDPRRVATPHRRR